MTTSLRDSPAGDFLIGTSEDWHYSGYASGVDNGIYFVPRSIKGYDWRILYHVKAKYIHDSRIPYQKRDSEPYGLCQKAWSGCDQGNDSHVESALPINVER